MNENYIVARVGQATRSDAKHMQNHNDRRREWYRNTDIILERSVLNVELIPLKDDRNYTDIFDEMISKGLISTRGLKSDAVIFNEILHDVNSEYWLQYETFGYKSPEDFAMAYFYDCLEFDKEKFGEDKILSAVCHFDEINRELTEKYGLHVYHYHMHVVVIPTVDKEIYWTKRCKNPELVGTLKEKITQVSDSKFWQWQPGEEKSYAKFQTEIYEYLHEKYPDLQRGEKNSQAKHLNTEDYKAAMRQLEALKKQNRALEIEKEATEQLLSESLAEIERLEKRLKEVIEYDPLPELEQDIPKDKRELIDWCINHLKGVFEAVYEFCAKQYLKYKKARENEKLGEIKAIKNEASSLAEKISAASKRTYTADIPGRATEKEKEH